MRKDGLRITRRYNLGNNEFIEYEVTKLCSDKEPWGVLGPLSTKYINELHQLTLGSSVVKETATVTKAPVEEKKPEEVVEEKVEVEKPVGTPEPDKEPVAVEAPAKKKRRSKEEIAADKAAKEAAKEAKRMAKHTKYDRSNDAHKGVFTEILNDRCDGWKKHVLSKKAALQVSMDLEGEYFLDDKNEIIGTVADKIYEAVSKHLPQV